MRDIQLVLMQTRYQLISTARNRRAVLFSFILPAVLLVMFNSVFAPGNGTVDLGGEHVGGHAYFTGGMLTYAILLSAFSQLAIGLVNQRESGELKRLRGTPVPAWTFIAATILRAVAVVASMAVVLILIARLGYGVRFSASGLADVVLFAALGTAALAGVAMAATALVTDVDSAGAVLPLIAVILSLISGIFVPIDQLPSGLEDIARIFPVYHLAEGLQMALGNAGAGTLSGGDVLSLAAWGVLAAAFAARRFRWEPHAATA
jgi:ABC-2 type transport system permease protein